VSVRAAREVGDLTVGPDPQRITERSIGTLQKDVGQPVRA
jgi:hypothetical protein